MTGATPKAWIVPRGDRSVFYRRAAGVTYRTGSAELIEVGPVPMPPRALHALDLEADTLVYVDRGALHVLRGITRGAPAVSAVEVPFETGILALTMVDEVIYLGAGAGPRMLCIVDLRAELRARALEIPGWLCAPGKGIDALIVHGQRLIAVDDMVAPRYLIVLDVTHPRAPRVLGYAILPWHSTNEYNISVAAAGDTMVLLSHAGNHGVATAHVSLMDLPALAEWAALTVLAGKSSLFPGDRPYDLCAVALHEDTVLLAAGRDGIGLLRVPPRPAALARRRSRDPDGAPSDAPKIPVEDLRLVPVAGGRVVDVLPVDAAHAFAVIEREASGLFRRAAYDGVLVSLPAS